MSAFRIYLRLLREGVLFAWNAIVVNRLRTFLSLLGITIGIFAIISVFTLVDSMENSVRNSFSKLGDDSIFIERMPWGPEPGDKEYAWWKYSQRPGIKYSEANQLRQRMATAGAVTFFSSARRRMEYGNAVVENAVAVAVSSGFENFITVDVAQGRSFADWEMESNSRLALLGSDVAERLFGAINPLGKRIDINGYKATVIGVLKKEGQGLMGNGADEWAIVPVSFGRNIMQIDQAQTQIALKPKPGVAFEAMENEALMNMRSIRMLRPQEDKNFALNKSSMINNSLDQLFEFLTLAGLIIGGFSILVGGFSIANIMFVSVRERTSIIGIQKALGAKRSFILFQFLFESVLLCIVGGAIGLILIYFIALATSSFTDFDITLSLENILIGLGFSVGIGVVSGIVPALMAARMEPVDAIRSNG